jgi:uncharacterized membrane protein required for colicin V production
MVRFISALNLLSLASFACAFLVALHHYFKHPELEGWRRWIQLKDIDNHETVVIFLIGLGIGALF